MGLSPPCWLLGLENGGSCANSGPGLVRLGACAPQAREAECSALAGAGGAVVSALRLTTARTLHSLWPEQVTGISWPSAKLNSLSQSDLKSGINDPASHPLWRHWMAQGAQAPHCSPCLALFNFRKRLLIGQMTFKSLWRKGVPPCGSFSIQTFMLYQMDKGLPPALRVWMQFCCTWKKSVSIHLIKVEHSN